MVNHGGKIVTSSGFVNPELLLVDLWCLELTSHRCPVRPTGSCITVPALPPAHPPDTFSL
jgi:hypothetical protein